MRIIDDPSLHVQDIMKVILIFEYNCLLMLDSSSLSGFF